MIAEKRELDVRYSDGSNPSRSEYPLDRGWHLWTRVWRQAEGGWSPWGPDRTTYASRASALEASRRAQAAALLGRKGGKAGRGASQRRGDSAHYATLGDRPVVAVRHTAAGELLEDWPIVGRARSLTAAIRVVREAGYTVPDRGTPGYRWDPQDRTPHQDDAHLTDAERQAERVSCWSVPVLV